MGRHLHFDCFSGVSGDMLLGALVDAGLPVKDLIRGLAALPVRGYEIRSRKVTRGSVQATKVDVVLHEGFRSPLSLSRIHRIIASSRMPDPVPQRAHAVFERLAGAEGVAHQVKPDEVQFHEVGVIDSLVDVVGSLLGFHLLGATRFTASAINVGSGLIDTAHGRLPVPGPAVAALAKGIPVYANGPDQELTTPTGLAVLGTVVNEFGSLPLMRPEVVGYGAGSANPKGWPNALRVLVGDISRASGTDVSHGCDEVIVQVETNLDDLQPQAYETVIDRLFAGGALDVTLTPVIMKRGRPGIILAALASREKAEGLARVILRDTTALGVRMHEANRMVLPRRMLTVKVAGGEVNMKVAEVEPGLTKAAPEYSDCKRIAEQTGRPVRDVMEDAMRSFRAQAAGGKAKGKRRKR